MCGFTGSCVSRLGLLQSFPAAGKEEFQRILNRLIPESPFMNAWPLSIAKFIRQRLYRVPETGIMRVQKILAAAGDHYLGEPVFAMVIK